MARRRRDGLARTAALRLAPFVAGQLAKVDGNPAHDDFYRRGFHLLRRHFYCVVPDAEEIPDDYWEQRSDLRGVDLNGEVSMELLEDVFPRYEGEFRSIFPIEQPPDWRPGEFYLLNGTFMAVDAQVYFSLIRQFRPNRIIEIGAGNSTLVALAAGRANGSHGGAVPKLTAIEPFPWDVFRNGLHGLDELIDRPLQSVDITRFDELDSGDILFIDSSHVLRAGSDVELEYLEILPRLRRGVLVHIHDISLPRRYPKVYFDQQNYWNEQQLLQAFLAFNKEYEVVWPGNAMYLGHRTRILDAFTGLRLMESRFPGSHPTSFWIRRI